MSESPRLPEEATRFEAPKEGETQTSALKKPSWFRREFAVLGTVAALGTAYAVKECSKEPTHKEQNVDRNKRFRLPDALSHTYFDTNPDYFKTITEHGEFTPEERQKREKTLKNGAHIFEDVGMNFYKVRAGDTISTIRENLAELPEYRYLKDQKTKTASFNIPAGALIEGMYIPIPLENQDRHVTDEQFARYAAKALYDMQDDPHYGNFLQKKVLSVVSEKELVATMVAVAKQESGSDLIGQYELHRWENAYKAFSFSEFHILMEKNADGSPGPGLSARKKLNLSEGQVYHPYHASKLFIAYLKEKHGNPEKFLPLSKNAAAFASLYNGASWERINPHYVDNVGRYYKQALAMLTTLERQNDDWEFDYITDDDSKPHHTSPITAQKESKPPHQVKPQAKKDPTTHKDKSPSKSPDTKQIDRVFTAWEQIGARNLTTVVENANYIYRKETGKGVFTSDDEVSSGTNIIMSYLRRRFGSDDYTPKDKIGIGVDEHGPFFKFSGERDKKIYKELIRITGIKKVNKGRGK